MISIEHLAPHLVPALAPAGDVTGAGDVLRARVVGEAAGWAHRIVAVYVLYQEMYGRIEQQILAAPQGTAAEAARKRQGLAVREADMYAAIAVRLRVSTFAARAQIDTAVALVERLPRVFALAGLAVIPYYRVELILHRARILDTEQAARFDALLAGELEAEPERIFSKGQLIDLCDRLVHHIDPDGVEQQNETAKQDRRVEFTPDLDGMAWVNAHLTASEAREVHGRLEKLAGTVCSEDPRTRDQLWADALMAVMEGYATLGCRCPLAGCTLRERRRGGGAGLDTIVEILVVANAATLAGTDQRPGYLAGHGVISAGHVRDLAARPDARLRPVTVPDGTTTPDDTGASAPAAAVGPAGPAASEASAADEAVAAGSTVTNDGVTDVQSPEHPAPVPTQPVPTQPVPTQPVPTQLVPTQLVPTQLVPTQLVPTQLVPTEPEWVESDSGATKHGAVNDSSASGAVSAGYRPSVSLARLVRIVFPACTFPGCTRPAAGCELDHRIAYDHRNPVGGGPTSASNLQPLCKFHHALKTFGDWACTARPGCPGVIDWTDPTGRVFSSDTGAAMREMFPDLFTGVDLAWTAPAPADGQPPASKPRSQRAERIRRRRHRANEDARLLHEAQEQAEEQRRLAEYEEQKRIHNRDIAEYTNALDDYEWDHVRWVWQCEAAEQNGQDSPPPPPQPQPPSTKPPHEADGPPPF
ncbi:HNH endonuclease signature motif containing protein [Tsukamurella soli]|uniref:DUF222 domain-containing protein n=1 Tax=Tsukamurella soli TaxID=644556 RepID=A0ABP8JLJ0_9ACTN